MSRLQMSERDRRALTFGAAALGILLAVRFLLLPYLASVRDHSTRLVAAQDALRTERRMIAETRGAAAAFEAASVRFLAAAPRLLSASSPTAAQTRLLEGIQKAVADLPARVDRVEALAVSPGGSGLTTVPIRVEGETDLEGLLTTLAVLEASPLLLRVEDLHIETRPPTGFTEPSAPAPVEVLLFRFTMIGYLLSEDWDLADSTAEPVSEPPPAMPVGRVPGPREGL